MWLEGPPPPREILALHTKKRNPEMRGILGTLLESGTALSPRGVPWRTMIACNTSQVGVEREREAAEEARRKVQSEIEARTCMLYAA